jgi:hypothetical protein
MTDHRRDVHQRMSRRGLALCVVLTLAAGCMSLPTGPSFTATPKGHCRSESRAARCRSAHPTRCRGTRASVRTCPA